MGRQGLGCLGDAGGRRVLCQIPRETIHEIPAFNDIISREIVRDREEIIERLRAAIHSKVARTDGKLVQLTAFGINV
jgi:hypothetical protein